MLLLALVNIYFVAWLLPCVSGQFHFFDSMFGQQNQRQQANRAAGASQWAAQADIGKFSSTYYNNYILYQYWFLNYHWWFVYFGRNDICMKFRVTLIYAQQRLHVYAPHLSVPVPVQRITNVSYKTLRRKVLQQWSVQEGQMDVLK